MGQAQRIDAGLVAALSPQTWYNLGLAVVLVAVAVAAIVAYRAWQEAHEDVEPATPEELLAAFDEARASGELEQEEYERIRERIERSSPRPPFEQRGDPA
jgi:hypothetical protein